MQDILHRIRATRPNKTIMVVEEGLCHRQVEVAEVDMIREVAVKAEVIRMAVR